MVNKIQRRISWILLVALVTQIIVPIPLSAQTLTIEDYLLPGERVVTLEPGLMYNGHVYQIHYFTTGDIDQDDASLIGAATPESFANQQIVGLLITADNEVVSDEAIIREILTVYRAAYFLYEDPIVDPLDVAEYYPFDELSRDIRRIINNPIFVEQFIKGLFESRKEQTEDAMRAIVTTQLPPPENIIAFQDEMNGRLAQGQSLIEVTDDVLEAARFSNDKSVREAAASLQVTFDSWTPISGKVKILSREVELLNALDLVSLTINLAHVDSYQHERIEWLNDYARFGAGAEAFDEDQQQALETVLAEVDSSWAPRKEIILDFIRDQGVDWGERIATEKLSRLWVKKSWETYGKRIAGHRAAGAASAVLLGFTLGNLLYGLDDLHSNFRTAERANELREVFHNGRIQLQATATNQSDDLYNGNLAARYQQVYMLESLAAAQVYRSYADGVDATVREGLTSIINPINWFKGKEWREAADGLREIGNNLERGAELAIGHPEFVDTAISLIWQRLAVLALPLGTCDINREDGIDLHEELIEDEEVYIVCVNLDDPYIRFQTVMANDVPNVNAVPDQRETLSSMVNRSPYQPHHPIVAINADYFGDGHGAEGFTVVNGRRIDGPASNDTDGNELNRVSQTVSRVNNFNIGFQTGNTVSNSKLYMTQQYNATGGGPTLVSNGRLIPDPCPPQGFSNFDECKETKQTAIGISQDGKTLIIVVARNKTGREMGELLMRYGAYQGMKLDGGSSSQLWYRGNLKMNGVAVANAIMILREEIPRHDALILEQSQFPVVQARESFSVTVRLANTGFLPWDSQLDYALQHVDGELFGIAPTIFLPQSAVVGTHYDTTFNLNGIAPNKVGSHQSVWQLIYQDSQGNIEPIGPEIGLLVTVVPEGTSPDFRNSLQQFIDQFVDEIEGNVRDYLDELQEEIEARIREELIKLLPPEIRCLFGLSIVMSNALGLSFFGRKRKYHG